MTEEATGRRSTYATGLRQRGELADQVKRACDGWITGELVVKDSLPLTPHRISLAIKKMEGLEEPPSTGAVKAVLDRWKESGFATMTTSPFAFEDYTEEGRLLGWRGIKDKRRAERADERANEKKSE